MPRILFVAMSESIHTARWINQLEGWDVHLFPSASLNVHPMLKDITVHGIDKPSWWKKIEPSRAKQLAQVIDKIRPDIVHSLEMQHSGYLTMEAKKLTTKPFPKWIYTPWGNDLYFFGQLDGHKYRIREVLESCDYYGPKSKRDVLLASAFGFKGKMLPAWPGNGGIDMEQVNKNPTYPTSNRKLIMLKGYQGSMGRALVALRVIEQHPALFKGYRIVMHSAGRATELKAKLITETVGVPIDIIPTISHEAMLDMYGRSRASISLSLSDGVPNSMLEAMAMGCIPIESDTSCAYEWVRHGSTGFIVPPEDHKPLAEALRFALNDNILVNRAAVINRVVIRDLASSSVIGPQVIATYKQILEA